MNKQRVATRAPILGMLIVAAITVLAACGSEEPTPTPESVPAPTAAGDGQVASGDQEPWEAEWAALIAAAQAEGELMIVGGSATIEFRPAFRVFQDKFGIRVISSGGSSSEIINRILAERAAGRYTIDHFISGSGTSFRLIEAGVLAPIAEQFILPEVKDVSLWWGGRHWYADAQQKYVFSHSASARLEDASSRVNTDHVPEEEYRSLTTLWDFLEPRWNGVTTARPPTPDGSSGYVGVYYHPDLGIEWLERFFQMDVTFINDQRLQTDQVALGAFALCIFCSGTAPELDRLQREGAPVRSLLELKETWTDAQSLSLGGSTAVASIVDRPSHPSAARLFINWFLSKEGQTAVDTLVTDRHPPPTLRTDVTEVGNTNPLERRLPGQDYFVETLLEGFDPQLAMDKSLELWEARR